jgi:AGZA family xanthine/uracil permease-like MFS transporter
MTDTAAPSERPFLDRHFQLTEHGTNVRTELLAGLTTFLTMVYIVFVNPQILGNAGMDKGAVFVATCIASAVSTAVMALYANYPIALAPGMGLNAFFAFTVVLSYRYTWQQALAAVFCSGVPASVSSSASSRSSRRRSWWRIPSPSSPWATSRIPRRSCACSDSC